jgi:hypothetical protein
MVTMMLRVVVQPPMPWLGWSRAIPNLLLWLHDHSNFFVFVSFLIFLSNKLALFHVKMKHIFCQKYSYNKGRMYFKEFFIF